jgi:hypothetical protein
MKFAAIAALSALALVACQSTEAEAAEIGNTGISIGAELDNRYNVDAEALTVTLTPEVGYNLAGFGLSASTDLELANNDGLTLNNDDLPTLDFGAEYGLGMWGLTSTVYAETGYDLEAEDMSDVEVGISFKF